MAADPLKPHMQTLTGAQISVDPSFNCMMAEQTLREITRGMGFAAKPTEEIVLATAALLSNLVRRNAGCALLTLRQLEDGDRIGVEVQVEDHGPRSRTVASALEDGHSTGGGLSCGLSTVHRLTDELEITSAAALGRRIRCVRWLRPEADTTRVHAWQVGIATRPYRSAEANGDAFVIREWDGHLLAAVIDGLGHGELAEQAALAAQSYVQSHYALPLDDLFRGVNQVCRPTRGVVMAIVRFDSPTAFTSANLGNIEIRSWTGNERLPITVQRGFLGAHEDHVRVEQHRWEPDWMLVLHSDGLRNRWQWDDFPGLHREPPQEVANQLLANLAKEEDDATIVAIKTSSDAP